jgi:gliding motility-associated protein GldC
MKKSTISFQIELDTNNVPERITWDASDKPGGTPQDTKSISIAVWDHTQKNTLRIDLWSKDMPVPDMKRFYVECIGGLAQSALTATGDAYLADSMNELCDRLVEHIRKEQKNS